MDNQNYANPDPGLVRRLRELRTPEAEIPALAARIMREVDAALRPLVACDACSHDRELHAFFPTGDPAPLCIGTYKPDDAALIDHSCPCEGFAPPTCEYTEDGMDPYPGDGDRYIGNPACGKPAVVCNPHGISGTGERWFDTDEWYCDEHADPAWPRPVRGRHP